jgi:hypothetical protein
MKLNPCEICKNADEFVVNNDLTVIYCRKCGQRKEKGDIFPGDVFEAWNKYNPLPKKEPVRLFVTKCSRCPMCTPDGIGAWCSIVRKQIVDAAGSTPPSWCPLRENGGFLIGIVEGA